MSSLIHRLFRTQRNPLSGQTSATAPNWIDVSYIGLKYTFGLAIYIVSCTIVQKVSGSAFILSICLATLLATLLAINFIEIRTRSSSFVGTAYEYVYRTFGELPAFIVGWSTILQHIAVTSLLARSISQNFDFLIGSPILNFTIATFDSHGERHLGDRPDFLAVGILIVIGSLILVGLKQPKYALLIVNCAAFLLLTFVCVVAVFHLDWTLWKKHFFLDGFGGVLEGTSSAMILFVGIVPMSSSINPTLSSSRSTFPLALFSKLFVSLLSFGAIALTFSLLADPDIYSTETVLPEGFALRHMSWIRYIFCFLAVIYCTILLRIYIRFGSKLLMKMSSHGLVIQIFKFQDRRTNAYTFSTLFVCVIGTVLTGLFETIHLVQLASFNFLFSQSICVLGLLCLKYYPVESFNLPPRRITTHNGKVYGSVDSETAPEQSEEGDIDRVVEDYLSEQNQRRFCSLGLAVHLSSFASAASFKRVVFSAAMFIVVSFIGCAILTIFYSQLAAGNGFLIFTLCVLLLVLFGFMGTIATQSQAEEGLCYNSSYIIKAPLTPWLNLLALELIVILLVRFRALYWIFSSVWVIIGLIIYVSYGFRNSEEAARVSIVDEEEQLLQATPSEPQSEAVQSTSDDEELLIPDD